MWKRVFERLLSSTVMVFLTVWFVTAMSLAAWVEDHTNVEVHRHGALGLIFMIFLAPIGAVVAIDELVIRRLRFGPPLPGRHTRGRLSTEELQVLDRRLAGRSDESPDP